MSFLKRIGKFFAGLFVLLGITIFIMSYFGANAVNNIDVLEEDISNNMDKLITDPEMQQLLEYCNQNPGDENCQSLNSITEENPILAQIEKEVSEFSYYGGMMRIFGIVFFVVGFLLFVWCNGWLSGIRSTSLISFIGLLFSYLYYRFAITGALTSFLPKEIIDMIGNWIIVSLNQTLNLILILGVTFLILTVGLYILKPLKKVLSKNKSKND